MKQGKERKQRGRGLQQRPSHALLSSHQAHQIRGWEKGKRPSYPASILQLQQQVGNSQVQRLLIQRDSSPESPDQEGRQLHTQAQTHFRAGQFAAALDLWRQIYSMSQLEAHIRRDIAFNMGSCHLRLGQNEQAIAIWQEYLLFADADQAMALENIRRARTDETLLPPGQLIPEVTPEQRETADAQAQQALDVGDTAGRPSDFSASLEHYRLAYSLPAASSHLRWQATWRMGFAHQRLRQFDQAISAWQESMGFPEATDATRLQVVELIRQARLGVDDPHTESITAMTEEEQHARFLEAQAAMAGGQYEAALAGFRAVYTQPSATPEVRQMMTFDMALCHQRLQQFEQAISLFEEYLLFPGVTDNDREQALEKVRQCRMQEVGLHITPASADTAVVGDERELLAGFVFFETGSHAVGAEGETTLDTIAQLLREQHAAHPTLTFRIIVVGASTRRWRTADSEEQADARNRILAEQRATSAATFLTEHLPDEDVAAGVFHTEARGTSDDVSEIMGLDPDDNNWTERHAAITVLASE